MSVPQTAFFDFMDRAEEYLAACKRLEPQPPCDWARYLLTGHAVEVALKAHLLARGMTIETLRSRDFGHNLAALLAEATAKGLPPLSADVERHIGYLAEVHDKPYLTRYPDYEGQMATGIVVLRELEDSVDKLMQAVRIGLGLAR